MVVLKKIRTVIYKEVFYDLVIDTSDNKNSGCPYCCLYTECEHVKKTEGFNKELPCGKQIPLFSHLTLPPPTTNLQTSVTKVEKHRREIKRKLKISAEQLLLRIKENRNRERLRKTIKKLKIK